MDHLAELAEHADLHQALELLEKKYDRVDPDDAFLSLLHKLAQNELYKEHPHAWISEAIQAFYRQPRLAAEAWTHLRYCSSFCSRTAERLLIYETSWTWKRSLPAEVSRHITSELIRKFQRGETTEAISSLCEKLEDDRAAIDEVCRRPAWRPLAPQFIEDVLRAENILENRADETIQSLLRSPERVRQIARDRRMAVPFSMVLEQELDQIIETRKQAQRSQRGVSEDSRHPLRRAIDANLIGLTFSGGGIRSATFNLGVLQALARNGLLRQCDYLSTVSGGGYIGGWFAAWLRRDACDQSSDKAIEEMQRRLSPTRSPNPMDEREKPIRYLREYSNYLTPRTGLLSADTWTMLGIYLRNTLLNQVIIVALMAAALMLPRVWYPIVDLMNETARLVCAAVLLLVGLVFLIANLRRLEPRTHISDFVGSGTAASAARSTPVWYATPTCIQLGVAAPWLAGAALLMHAYAKIIAKPRCEAPFLSWFQPLFCRVKEPCRTIAFLDQGPLLTSGVVFFLLTSSLSLGKAHLSWTHGKDGAEARWAWLHASGAIAWAGFVAAIIAACLQYIALNLILSAAYSPEALTWHLTVLGPAATIAVFSISIVAMLGMLGRHFPDEHREWWSRLRTFLHVWALASAAWVLASLYVPWAVEWFKLDWPAGTTAFLVWVGSTIFGLKKGQAADQDNGTANAPQRMNAGMQAAVFVAPYLCIVGLLVFASLGIHAVFKHQFDHLFPGQARDYWQFVTWTTTADPSSPDAPQNLWRIVAWTSGLIGIGLLFSWRVDINEFSIHHFYRNRLVRCYLGASHRYRRADWFTGFDPRDDMPLCSFDSKTTNHVLYPGPYPIINCALNLVGGQDLAWQERKAASFIFSPKFCGYDLDRAVLRKTNHSLRSEAFVPTQHFHNDDVGPLLGMAMAVSGAAVNPNTGRATTPAAAFLMTMFNVRLGWWITNPRRQAKRPSPPIGLAYTALELFGGTDDRRQYVNLSDGGHFDNLGVYELVRRGCRYIIVSDAGQDPEMLCEDLGNVIRKCRTDFGVEIEISVECVRAQMKGLSAAHCVVGKIHYLNIPKRMPEGGSVQNKGGELVGEDGEPLHLRSRPAHEAGYLVYLKASMTGDEPLDVQEYSRRIPEFPHQSTTDQWFDESQFESYRKLGMHVATEAFGRYLEEGAEGISDPACLFEQLHRHWHPPASPPAQGCSEHSAGYARLLERLGTLQPPNALDHTVFENLPISEDKLPTREQLYACSALIQLMYSVYTQLDLERNWEHPHCEGWMRLFKRWAMRPEVQRAWRSSETGYTQRFRSFYRDRLALSALPLPVDFVGERYMLSDSRLPARARKSGTQVLLITVRQLLNGDLFVWELERIGAQRVANVDPKVYANFDFLKLTACLSALDRGIQLIIVLGARDLAAGVFKALEEAQRSARDYVVAASDESVLMQARHVFLRARVGRCVTSKAELSDALASVPVRVKAPADFLVCDSSLLTPQALELARQKGSLMVATGRMPPDRIHDLLQDSSVAGVVKTVEDPMQWVRTTAHAAAAAGCRMRRR